MIAGFWHWRFKMSTYRIGPQKLYFNNAPLRILLINIFVYYVYVGMYLDVCVWVHRCWCRYLQRLNAWVPLELEFVRCACWGLKSGPWQEYYNTLNY